MRVARRVWGALLAVVGVLGWSWIGGQIVAAPSLPIYLEDCHAGGFYWLAQTLDLDQPCVLLHFDAHSDADALFSSDDLREALRRVPTAQERVRRLEAWRGKGVVQCFNWIEPLMPRPFERVVWVPAETLSSNDQNARQSEARAFLDGHEEVAPRACGSLAEHYEVRSFENLRAAGPERWSGGLPIVASVDLDYFAALPDEALPAAFEHVFSYLLGLDRLQAITVAVSTPYLRDQAQAQRLVGLALAASSSVDNAEVRFEPFARTGPDRSRAARILAAQGQPLPFYDPAAAPSELRALCVRQRGRLRVLVEPERWRQLLDTWETELSPWKITVRAADQSEPDAEGCWHLPEGNAFSVGFVTGSASGSGHVRVRWFASQAAASVYNVVEPRVEGSFAAGAPRFIRRVARPVREDTSLEQALTEAQLCPFFDPATGLGNLCIYAEVEREDGSRVVTNALRLCRVRGTGLPGALTAGFNRPYVYGSGLLRDGDGATGPETGVGADCANFLIAGLRRQGWRLPWGNADQLRRHLEPMVPGMVCLGADGQADAHGPVTLDPADSDRGTFLDFGTHMAALWEDREPRGVLDGGDLVVHQLEGLPEVLPLRELLARRPTPEFRLERLCATPVECRLLFGGDVMLAQRHDGPSSEQSLNPLAPLAGRFRTVDLGVVNLECAITDRGDKAVGKALTFRAPPHAAETLREAGIGAVSVANNHVGDLGATGFLDTLDHLDRAGEKWFGGGRGKGEAYRARLVRAGSLQVALIGYSDADTGLLPAADPMGGLAVSDEWPAVLSAVRVVHKEQGADCVVVMPHWGQENTREVEERQRGQARDLIEAGADLVVGSGPHRVQRQEEINGHLVVYSLGNLFFDPGTPAPAWWLEGELLEVSLGQDGRVLRVRTIPTQTRNGTVGTAASQP